MELIAGEGMEDSYLRFACSPQLGHHCLRLWNLFVVSLISQKELCTLLSEASIITSSLFLGCCASSRSFAESRCVRASSTGPKTLLFRAALLAFLVLARAPFAMMMISEVRKGGYFAGNFQFIAQ
jgi:hypothetical protein